MKLLLYCTKAKPYLLDLRKTYEEIKFDLFNKKDKLDRWNILNGKVVGECDFEVEEKLNYGLARRSELELKGTCLTMEQLDKYLPKHKEYDDKDVFYYIHIKNLHIFDEPREITDLVLLNQYRKDLEGTQYNRVKAAPQNMCLVDYSINAVDKYKNYIFDCPYVLVSIQPQWLCKILNGEKTIEVRKKVLKEML